MLTLAACFSALLAAGCLANSAHHIVDFSKAEQEFSIELFKDLAADSKHVNDVIFSPFSVFSAFLTAYVASAGVTQHSLQHFLHLDTPKIRDKSYIVDTFFHGSAFQHSNLYVLRSADRIFHTPDFKVTKKGKKEFGSKIAVFKSKDPAEEVNKWVSKETHGMIKELVPKNAIPTEEYIVFANAAYFKGYWTIPLTGRTSIKPFTLANGRVQQTKFMSPPINENYKLVYDRELKAQVISLPYQGHDISMIIILPTTKPQKYRSPALAEVVKKLTSNKFLQLVTELENHKTSSVDLLIPKFESEERYDLMKILSKHGESKLFSGRWDLSNVFEHVDVPVQSVLHSAEIKVSENGTEAAAATAIITGNSWTPSVKFHAEHPFVYLIYDKTRQIIHYMGILNHPKQHH